MSDCVGYGVPNASACSSKFWEFVNSSYNTPELYIGSVCRSFLLAWQDCAIGPIDSANIVINATQDQMITEEDINETVQTIG